VLILALSVARSQCIVGHLLFRRRQRVCIWSQVLSSGSSDSAGRHHQVGLIMFDSSLFT